MLEEPLDIGRVARLPDNQKDALTKIAQLCRTRRIAGVIDTLFTCVFAAFALRSWYVGDRTAYIILLIGAAFLLFCAITYYRKIRHVETHPILGYLLAIRECFVTLTPAEQAEAERRSAWKQKVEHVQATGRPGFADEEDGGAACAFDCPDCPENCKLEEDEAFLRKEARHDCDFFCAKCPPLCAGDCPV